MGHSVPLIKATRYKIGDNNSRENPTGTNSLAHTMASGYPDDYRVLSEYLNSCGTEVSLLVDTSSKKQEPGFKLLRQTANSSLLHERKRKQRDKISTQPPLDVSCNSTHKYCSPPPQKNN